MTTGSPPDGPLDALRWLSTTDHGLVRFGREVLSSAGIVLLVGILLFAASGVWPPMVAVESGSMEPHLFRGDLVFVMDEQRLVPAAAVDGTGVATYQSSASTDYHRFGDRGDVIVFTPDGSTRTPVIHRARFWVDAGENWFDQADADYVQGGSCMTVPNCPAPHAGFITKGDANPYYDQVSGISGPVNPSWIKGTAELRVPLLGHIRLQFSELTSSVIAPPIRPVAG